MTQTEELKSLVGGPEERQAFLDRVSPAMGEQDRQRLSRLLELIAWLLNLLESKNLSIKKLRELCFGAPTESAHNVCGTPRKPREKTKPKGHGRNSHEQYPGAQRVSVSHPTLQAGQTCPECARGKLYRLKQWAIAMKITAQALITAVIFQLERLRCNRCGKVFTAPLPPEAAIHKYDPSVGVMVALMRYGAGMPFYRLQRLQAALGVPLPCSVQWERCNELARSIEPILDHLIYRAAQSWLVCTDDTTMRVRSLKNQIQSETETDSQRKGLFTTGLVAEVEGHSVALFFTGRSHAGENLTSVLDLREAGLSPPMHMSDGLNRNAPTGHETTQCQCNAHGRRNFVEIYHAFPEECGLVIGCLSEVYAVDAKAKREGLDAAQRLKLHQTESRPVMDWLKIWLDAQIEERKVEPNSTLGQAIQYLRKRWTALTRFLEIAGAPLDNNVTERFLKMAILHRKNSMFYLTERGAAVGDLFMSLIQTCQANQINPFEYLLALARNPEALKANPAHWLPWNYQSTLDGSAAA